MCTGSVQKSVANNYFSHQGKVFDRGAKFAEHFEQVLMIGSYGAAIGQHAYTLKGDTEKASLWERASNAFGTARDGLNACRWVFAWEKLFTGKWLYRQFTRKDEMDARAAGKLWILEGDWVKVKMDTATGKPEVDADNKPIYAEDGEYVKHDWMDIVMFILVLVARTLSPFNFLNSKKVVDFGVHAKRMGATVIGCWGVILSLGLIQSIRELAKSKTSDEMKDNTFQLAESFFCLASFPSDCGVGMKNPVTAIVGAALNVFYPVVALARFVYVYR